MNCRSARIARRERTPKAGALGCAPDDLRCLPAEECLRRFKAAKILAVRGQDSGDAGEMMGIKPFLSLEDGCFVPLEKVRANDYNPNAVAPPEMALLETSIWEDGYTQPVVTYYDKDADLKLYGLDRPSRVIVITQQGGAA